MNDLSYDLFYNSSAKILGNKPVFTPEELATKKTEILNLIMQSNHSDEVKSKAVVYLNNNIRIRQKIKQNLSGFKYISQQGTKDAEMFKEEKFLVSITSKINKLFGPANSKLFLAKDFNEKYALIINLSNDVKKEIDNSLSSIKDFQKLDKYKTILENIYNNKISNLKNKYLNSKITNKPTNLQSGTVSVPNLLGLTSQDADNKLLQSELEINIKQVKSSKPINTVVNQIPKPGEIKSKGSTVSIHVSAGP